MRYAWLMGALALTSVSGNVYAQNADGESRKDDVSEDGRQTDELSPESGKEALKTGPKVAQVGQAPGSRSSNNGQATNDDDEPDQVEPEEEIPDQIPARVPWRGSAFAWKHNVTTSALGIGADYQSGDQQVYSQTFAVGLNYFVIDQQKWSLAVTVSPSVSVELTNSNVTTKRNEPQMNDLPLSVSYRRSLYSHDTLPIATGLVLRGSAYFPTSPLSYNIGTYFRTGPTAVLWQAIPLIPKDVSWFGNAIVFGVAGSYQRRFGAANVPINAGLDIQRQNNLGLSYNPDTLTGSRVARDNFSESAFFFFSQPIGPTQLYLSGGLGLSQQVLPAIEVPGGDLDGCAIKTNTGCVTYRELDKNGVSNPRGTRLQYSFGLSASFYPVPEAGVTLGYSNSTDQLGPDGTRRNVFYTPNAQFSAGLIVSFDAIYEGLTGPRRSSPFVLVSKNEKKKQREHKQKREDRTKAMELPTTF